MDFDVYTNILRSTGFQEIISPYREGFLITALIFALLALYLFLIDGWILGEAVRRIKDFLFYEKTERPRKFPAQWKKVSLLLQQEKYKEAVKEGEEMMLALFKRLGYSGKSFTSLIDSNQIQGGAVKNIEKIKKLGELSREKNPDPEEVKEVFKAIEEALKKLEILE